MVEKMVANASIVSDMITSIKTLIDDNVTDPASATRPLTTKFVLTAYPKTRVYYPTIIVTQSGGRDTPHTIGGGGETRIVTIRLRIEVWSDNITERNTVWDELYNELRTHFSTVDGSGHSITGYDIQTFNMLSCSELDTPLAGGSIRRKIAEFQLKFYAN